MRFWKNGSRRLVGGAVLSAAAAAFFAPAHAQADIITTLAQGPTLVTTGANAGLYEYVYDEELGFDSELAPSNVSGISLFGTIYDVSSSLPVFNTAQFPATGLLATAFTFTDNHTDTPATKVSPTDSSLYNIRFTYNGSSILMGQTYNVTIGAITVPVGTSLMDLGTFTVLSPTSITSQQNFDGQTIGSVGYSAAGTVQSNLGTTLVPTATAVPEPVSLALAAVSAAGLLGRRRRSL